ARLAVDELRRHAGESAVALIQRCHQRLLRSRGAVLTLGVLRDDTLTWLGVGNVEGALLPAGPARRREAAPLRGGVVGGQIPPLRASAVALCPGDRLLLATDGIRSGFLDRLGFLGTPQQIA